MHSFKIYGIWPQASKHTHTLPQCSHASVGLAQARPNEGGEREGEGEGKRGGRKREGGKEGERGEGGGGKAREREREGECTGRKGKLHDRRWEPEGYVCSIGRGYLW